MNLREDLKAYLDGELSPQRMEEIRAALEADPALREELEFMRLMGFEIKRMAAEPHVTGVEGALGRLRGFRWPSFVRDRRWVLAGSALTVCVAVVAVSQFSGRLARDSDATASIPASGGLAFEGMEAKRPLELHEAEAMQMDKGRSGLNGAMPESVVPGNVGGGAIPAPIPQMVIQTADLSVTVPSAREALIAARRIATGLGGFVESSSHSQQQQGLPYAHLGIRVPAKQFETALDQLGALGEVVTLNTSGQDVTEQVVDVQARIKTMKAEEEQYRLILSRANKIGEILEVKSRLDQVRQEIESLQARYQYLSSQASYSTITATFSEKQTLDKPEAPKDWANDSWTNAVRGLTAVGRWLGEWAIRVFVFAPIWLPILGIGWWLSRRARPKSP
ncbi:MAG: lipoprotein [Chthonomonas sp.]